MKRGEIKNVVHIVSRQDHLMLDIYDGLTNLGSATHPMQIATNQHYYTSGVQFVREKRPERDMLKVSSSHFV